MNHRLVNSLRSVAALLAASVTASVAQADCHGLLLEAHRGAYTAPENSFSAVQQAMAGEWDGAEIDIQPLNDGQWVLHHDDRLGRTTSLQGHTTTQLSPDAWREVRLKGRDGRLTSEPPPFLADLVKGIPERSGKALNIEIKQFNPNCASVQGVADAMQRGWPQGQWFFTAIDRRALTCARRGDPHGYLAQIVLDPQALARESKGRLRSLESFVKPPTLDRNWLLRLKQEVGEPVGVHVDVNTLEANPHLLADALSLGMPVLTYHLGPDREHVAALRREARQSGLLPSGAIINGPAQAFCSMLEAQQ